MTPSETAGTTPSPESGTPPVWSGASCPLGYPKGLPRGSALAQGREGGSAGSRARAPETQQSNQRHEAPVGEEEPAESDRDAPLTREPAFPDRKPRRRAYQPRHREDVIAVRLSLDEKSEITTAAKRAEMYPSGYLAAAGLAAARGTTAVKSNAQLDSAIDELAALRAHIARVGNNINQIAHIYNAGGKPQPGELTHALTTVSRVLARIDDAADALVKKRT